MAKTAVVKKVVTKPGKDKSTGKSDKTEAKVFSAGDLADELGVTAFTARMKLRAAGIEKSGRSYEFKGQKAFDAAVKACKAVKVKGEE